MGVCLPHRTPADGAQSQRCCCPPSRLQCKRLPRTAASWPSTADIYKKTHLGNFKSCSVRLSFGRATLCNWRGATSGDVTVCRSARVASAGQEPVKCHRKHIYRHRQRCCTDSCMRGKRGAARVRCYRVLEYVSAAVCCHVALVDRHSTV